MVDWLICSRRLGSLAALFVASVGLSALCALALALAGRADAQPSCSQSGSTITCTFGYTGAAQTWTVPPGVTTATFDVQGAPGGVGAGLNSGGGGGEATADLPLAPGTTVTLVVGGAGGSPGPCSGAGGGGFNGGAAGGAYSFGGCTDGGGGGGGASDVRIGGSALTDRVLVAGGGGGAPGGIGCGNGGGGGGLTGGAGTPGINNCGGDNGGGGDQTGASGSGQLGVGSDGATLGGGGGGGYYGGARSDYIGGGGGGSGFGPAGTTFMTGVSGAGQITVSYAAPTSVDHDPANGATYALDQALDSSFSCTDITGGPGIQSCVDQNGNRSGTPIDTSTPGSYSFTVTATNKDGLSGTASVSYTVAKGSQAIAFTSSPPSPAVFGGSYTPAATGGASGNPVVFSVDASSDPGVCSLNAAGTTVSLTGAGTCVVDADQAGDADYDAAAQRQQSFTVAGLPSPRIASPADGGMFAVSQRVPTSFSCADGTDGVGISSCTDSNGASAPGGVLDTSKPGTFTYTVTATSKDGLTARASVHYTVAGAPSAQVSSPAGGVSYTRGQLIDASYACREGASGPGLASCAGTVPAGTTVDTSTPGTHTFTVTARSNDGQTSTTTVSYTVALPANQFAITDLHLRPHGRVSFRVAFPGPGVADVLETAWRDNFAHAAVLLQPAPRRFVFARQHLRASHAGTVSVTIDAGKHGRNLIAHHRYAVTATPLGQPHPHQRHPTQHRHLPPTRRRTQTPPPRLRTAENGGRRRGTARRSDADRPPEDPSLIKLSRNKGTVTVANRARVAWARRDRWISIGATARPGCCSVVWLQHALRAR